MAAGSSSQMASSSDDDKPGSSQFVREIPRKKLSNIIGSNSQGDYLNLLETKTKCTFTFLPANDDWKCILKVWGPVEKLPEAEKLVDELLNQVHKEEKNVRGKKFRDPIVIPPFDDSPLDDS